MRRITAAVLVVALTMPSVALAQTAQAQDPGVVTAPPSAAAADTVDAAKLGVSLARIRRELGQAEADPRRDGVLKLTFTVQVVGQAPKINLLEGFPVSGPLPYGSPTHQEVLDVLTPQLFRAPVMPFSALAVWAAQKLWDKSKKQRCEEEIAEYRRAVMAGIAIAAPRCTQ